MTHAMRPSTLQTMGLGSVLEVFERGGFPVSTAELVDEVFGKAPERGSLVISGANGIVGAGKTMQLGSRLQPYRVPVVALDFPGAPDGIGGQYPGLVRAFGPEGAAAIMANVTRLTYDGKSLPAELESYRPRFLLEAIPEVLEIKKAHYALFRSAFPEIEIRSVTSGFPGKELGVGIAHPAFPHEINKLWEIVESEPSPITQLLWSMGMIPVPVSDDWSFVLDVLFCGLTLATLRYTEASNMPYWKADKYVRRMLGPNPLRAHDAIEAKGANFLTWSCLHHLSEHYGEVFTPARSLVEHKDSGQTWYPPNHFRPLVNWTMEEADEDEFRAWILGPVFQMTTLMLKEKRAHLTHMNLIGELCAQFTSGVLAKIRQIGPEETVRVVEAYHERHPGAAKNAWHPEVLENLPTPEWQQLYVNAEHNGTAGVISISRESYNADVDAELNRAIDWLKAAGIERVVLSGDFHFSTQMVGADTAEFYPAMEDEKNGVAVSRAWSVTARRLNDEFETSVGLVDGKRCLGGYLELMMHCHYLVAEQGTQLGLPEVTLPVVPGMEGCHWSFRKAPAKSWPHLVSLLLTGRPVKARDAVGWLVDFAGPREEAIRTAWRIATGADHGLARRKLVQSKLDRAATVPPGLGDADSPDAGAARQAILACVRDATEASLADALEIQAKHSGAFMGSKECRRGMVGTAYEKTVKI